MKVVQALRTVWSKPASIDRDDRGYWRVCLAGEWAKESKTHYAHITYTAVDIDKSLIRAFTKTFRKLVNKDDPTNT